MYFDLNVPVPAPATQPQTQGPASKKNKGKQPAAQLQQQNVAYSAAQIARLESRIDLLIRLGYSVIAFDQTVISKVDPRSHVNVLDPLLRQLKQREGVLFLKRLTIVLDEDSERGNGLSAGNASLFSPYDILALHPTTQTSLANACLTHTQPSTLTTHIISLPLTAPRLPFRLKHTLVRTAIKNGAVFEINYTGALQGDDDRRNWWAAARELTRVTKGKGLIVSGGVDTDQYLRAPRDVGNLITLLGLAQNLAHDAATTTPKSLLLRAQIRKTYRAILSEPTLIIPSSRPTAAAPREAESPSASVAPLDKDETRSQANEDVSQKADTRHGVVSAATLEISVTELRKTIQGNGVKRPFDTMGEGASATKKEVSESGGSESRKKKKKRAKTAAGSAA